MNLTNKYNALEDFRKRVLPRVKAKYEVSGDVNPVKRKASWGNYIAFLELKKVISPALRKQWEIDSDWTSHYFINDLVNLK